MENDQEQKSEDPYPVDMVKPLRCVHDICVHGDTAHKAIGYTAAQSFSRLPGPFGMVETVLRLRCIRNDLSMWISFFTLSLLHRFDVLPYPGTSCVNEIHSPTTAHCLI